MAENNKQENQQNAGENQGQQSGQDSKENKTAGKFVAAGKPQTKAEPSVPAKPTATKKPEGEDAKTGSETEGTEGAEGDNKGGKSGENDTKDGQEGEKSSSQTQPLTREQIKDLFGFDGTPEELKEHLAKQGGSQKGKDGKEGKKKDEELTDEEKKKKETDFEKRLLSRFVDEGGTIENYALLKQLAEADPKDLSLKDLKRELKEAEFKDEEIEAIIRERYFEIDDDTLAQFEDESDKDFAKRKKAYGEKKLNSRGLEIQKKAKEALDGLRKAIEEEDADIVEEAELSSKVDEVASKVERKYTFEMGEAAGKQIDPVEFSVSDSEVEEALKPLKDPTDRNKILFTDDGKLNVEGISNLLVRNAILEKVAKAAYADGCTRTTEHFETIFPKNPHALGVGGAGASSKNGQGQKGKLVTAGKPTVGK
jgi:hypothetical protein